MTRLRKMMLESKITALVLGWVEDSVLRSDSRGFGVAESSSKWGVASIAGFRCARIAVSHSVSGRRANSYASEGLVNVV